MKPWTTSHIWGEAPRFHTRMAIYLAIKTELTVHYCHRLRIACGRSMNQYNSIG